MEKFAVRLKELRTEKRLRRKIWQNSWGLLSEHTAIMRKGNDFLTFRDFCD